MDAPPPLPLPIPDAKSHRSFAWVWFAVGGALLLAILIAFVVGAYFFVQTAQEKRARSTEAEAEIEKVANLERANLQQTLDQGNGADSIQRLRTQLEKSANKAGGADGPAYRALSATLQKLQDRSHEYEAASQVFKAAELFQFKLADRSEIEGKRTVVRDFLTANDRLADTIGRMDDILRAELDADKIPDAVKAGVMKGFSESQVKTRPITLHIRETDRRIGGIALEALDLLDLNWGKWKRDETTGQLRFQDDALLKRYNALVHDLQDVSAEQTKAQAELVAVSKAGPNAEADAPPAGGS